jgi:hypothetical protein
MTQTEKDNLLLTLQADIADLRHKLTCKEIEEKEKIREKKRILNPVNASILVALLSILGAIIINSIQQGANIKLEEKKLKSSLVIKALDAGDTAQVSKMLLFFVNNKLIEDKDSLITKSARNSTGLPTLSFFNAIPEMSTLTISNSKNICDFGPINGCWTESTLADAGDTIAVQVYYKNSSNTPSKETTLSIQPQESSPTNKLIFKGGVASITGPRAVGQATLILSSKQSVTYIPGSARWHPAIDQLAAVQENNLFGQTGFNIGTVMPNSQGILVAFFLVSNNK